MIVIEVISINMKTRHKFLIILFSTLLLTILLTGFLLYNGVLWFNHPSKQKYPIRGVDVSSYQGNIDWNLLSLQNIKFTFIKATEGSKSKDERFDINWKNANKTALKVGAYHFFSYDSDGSSQARNFMNNVPKRPNSLPPVIDIEFYGNKEKNPPSKKQVDEILHILLNNLESYYGKKPVIYCTEKSYNLYIKSGYASYPIWIRNIITQPSLSHDQKWTFWQYSNRVRLKGYNGSEKFIDMNVFNGTSQEFYDFAK